MEIYTGKLSNRITAEEVNVGENITMVIGMENYGEFFFVIHVIWTVLEKCFSLKLLPQ